MNDTKGFIQTITQTAYAHTRACILIMIYAYLLLFSNCSLAQDAQSLWSSSGHADTGAEAFNHWDDEKLIPMNCAACHSTSGFLDYLGADQSESLKVDKDHPIGSTVECNVCHNDTANSISKVVFPSKIEIEVNSNNDATCMICHQGRASTLTVNDKLSGLELDKVNSDLGFINIHYKAAAATLYGTEVKGGYEYEGKSYSGKFAHVRGYDSCSGCHNPHSLEVKVSNCRGCHAGIESPGQIRTDSTDFDGDGDITEGIASEIQALHSSLGAAISVYAQKISGSSILYSAHQYPYYFNDTNNNLEPDEDELQYPNRYSSWTPRLLRAAYNYQYVAKDTGAYVHNPKYVLQLLFDSLESLSAKMELDLAQVTRPK